MSFVKLDHGILDSSLWCDADARIVFLAALLMAVPYELRRATPQLLVDTLDPTGWEVPPGWYGHVSAAGPGIVRRAMIGEAAGMQALHRLGSPDPASRSTAYDGRRLARVGGGYLVLNYQAYRERDHSAAERQRRYRQRMSQRDVTSRGRTSRIEEEEGEEVQKASPPRGGNHAWMHATVPLVSEEGEVRGVQYQNHTATTCPQCGGAILAGRCFVCDTATGLERPERGRRSTISKRGMP